MHAMLGTSAPPCPRERDCPRDWPAIAQRARAAQRNDRVAVGDNMAVDVQTTHVEALNATEFLISSSDHASSCRSVAKLLFDTGACCAECGLAPLPPASLRIDMRHPPA